MKTLTIRLDDKEGRMIEAYMEAFHLKTATGAIRSMLQSQLSIVDENRELNEKLAEYKNIIAGLEKSSDTFKQLLAVIDQQELKM